MLRQLACAFILAVITSIRLVSLEAQAGDFRCDYLRKVRCDAAGCKADAIGSAYLLLPNVRSMVADTVVSKTSPGLPTIRRCDSSGCDPVVVRAWLNGAFVDITQPDRSYFVKVAAVELASQGVKLGDFVEVATTSIGTTTYFGSCKGAVK